MGRNPPQRLRFFLHRDPQYTHYDVLAKADKIQAEKSGNCLTKSVLAVIVTFGALGAPAHAENYAFLGIAQAEGSVSGISFHEGQSMSIGVGRDFGFFRGEIEYARLDAEAAGGRIQGKLDRLGGTAYLDISVTPWLTLSPALGGGHYQGEATVFGAQTGAVKGWDAHYSGQATLRITDRVKLAADYRRLHLLGVSEFGVRLFGAF